MTKRALLNHTVLFFLTLTVRLLSYVSEGACQFLLCKQINGSDKEAINQVYLIFMKLLFPL